MSIADKVKAVGKSMERPAPQTTPTPTPTQAKADDGLDLLRSAHKMSHGARKLVYEKALKHKAVNCE